MRAGIGNSARELEEMKRQSICAHCASLFGKIRRLCIYEGRNGRTTTAASTSILAKKYNDRG